MKNFIDVYKRQSVCYPKLNVKICATHSGITVGEDGATHQMIEDISLTVSYTHLRKNLTKVLIKRTV